MQKFVVAITGASGSAYAVRLLDVLMATGNEVHLTISPAAVKVFQEELGIEIRINDFSLEQLKPLRTPNSSALQLAASGDLPTGRLIYHHYQDYSAGIASGSFLTSGMVVCPCSMGTLASLANGISTNLIHRAADVHLKERRKLIVVPRETPLGSIQLQNMKTLADAGAVILAAMPGFYHQPKTIQDLVDFVVARICDQLGVKADLMKRWGNPPAEENSQAAKPDAGFHLRGERLA
ncbi:UbiX family flavin prenyltransferase [Planctomicrobium piriforme]|uniref:Flavin prenyltransferase UbiX n=1 Tax=Planctomicrobium piriforme TaxID=1576369 RepID=A0A1I3GV11_9PLAN|nr:flavin prenyltransferase UbiX [Planctomicrobium piriforme]SFI27408.1 4-hydroxy-3-polyprenylbenzoate decarboxylase [Planctomicrobium piriforme]